MDLRELILNLRGLILSQKGLSFGPERSDFWPERADLGPERGLGGGGRMDVWTYRHTDVRTYGCLEIHPCVLQDIGPLGRLPKKESSQKR